MVEWARQDFKRRACQVYTDMTTLRFPEQVYMNIEHIEEIAYIEDGLLLLDEAQIGLASGKWQAVPDEALRAMAQFRKNGLEVVYTTQHPDRVVKVLRENTHNWVRCRHVGPVIIQQWKTGLQAKLKGKVKMVRLRPSIYGLYDTLEVLGQKPSRKLVRSELLEAVRRMRSKAGPPPAADPFAVPVWHASTDGVQQLSLLASDVLDCLKLAGRPLEGNPEFWNWVKLEARRRVWLSQFGLKASDVDATCTIEHPWAICGCKCHKDYQDVDDWFNMVAVPWAVPDQAVKRSKSGAVLKVWGREFESSPQGLVRLVEWAGEALADKMGKFQVKGA